MPIESPFHPRTRALCTSYHWREWAGYHAVCSFDVHHDREYFAIRHAAGLLDVTPLFKYSVEGPDAADFLARVWTRDVRRLKVGQVAYGCWTDDAGKVLDDGTIARLDEQRFRMTSADPSYAWLAAQRRGYDVQIEELTQSVAALALQGPTARDVLKACTDAQLDDLRFFWCTTADLEGVPVLVTRTGYTGDLGYELWIPAERALHVWDALIAAGRPFGLTPIGLDALDVARVEAGFMLLGVDYRSARNCLAASQTSTPFELGLGWAVHLEREPFIGQAALQAEQRRGPAWRLVGLELDYEDLEALYDGIGLPVEVCTQAWRTPRPVYDGLQQVGYATSGAWSPTLKKDLALASLRSPYASLGRKLSIEVTVEFERRRVTATVVPRPFFDPERKKS